MNRDINKINNNFGQKKGKPQGLNNNKNMIKNKNFFMNLDNYNPIEGINTLQNQAGVIPFKYKPMYKTKKPLNNNNILVRNLNNPNLKKENLTLKNNINNKMNNKVHSINNKYNNKILYKINDFSNSNQFQPSKIKNQINIPSHISGYNNIILDNNINKNFQWGKNNNLRYSAEIPNYTLRNKENNFNLNNNDKNRNINKRKIKDESIEKDEDESLNNIAEDLFNFHMQENKKKKLKKRAKSKKELININKRNNDFEKVLNVSIQFPHTKLIEEVGCKTEISKSTKNSRRNSFSLNIENNNNKEKNKQQLEKVDVGIQSSLMPFLEIEPSTNKEIKNIININSENQEKNIKLNNQGKEEKIEKENKENKINEPSSSFNNNDNEIKDKAEEINLKENNNIFNSEIKLEDDLNSLKNSTVKLDEKIIEIDKKEKSDIDYKLGEEFIESDNENQKVYEKEKNKKKDRRIQFNFDNNIYFQFLKNDIMSNCQVKIGPLGELEYFNPKKEEDIFDSRIVFIKKPSIKPYNKDEIKVDKDYKLRENMEEKDIIPELYEDEEYAQIEDNALEELANSLRSSIDKSTDLSVNESLRRSINNSYNPNITNSLMSSINNEGQGILRRLKIAFEESQNKEN